MGTITLISHLALWSSLIAVGFLLLGTLRSLGLLQWRLDQLEATRPRRINRDGLKPGQKAPLFTLPRIGGGEYSLSDSQEHRTLLVFIQPGCQPCREIVPELNRRHSSGELRVVAVNNSEVDEARAWARETKAEFPVLLQSQHALSKKYQVFATPFAFLIDESARIAASGIIAKRQHVGFVLDAAANVVAVRTKQDIPHTNRESEKVSTTAKIADLTRQSVDF